MSFRYPMRNSWRHIQSAYTVPDQGKFRQELRSLLLADDSFQKILIVLDAVVPHHTEQGIRILSIYDFFLQEGIPELA